MEIFLEDGYLSIKGTTEDKLMSGELFYAEGRDVALVFVELFDEYSVL